MVALTQVVLLHLGQGDVHVVGARQVAGGAHERVVVEDVQHTRNRCQHIVFVQAGLVLFAAASLLLGALGLTVTLGTALGTLGVLTLGTLCALGLTVTLGTALGTLCAFGAFAVLIAATLAGAGALGALLAVNGAEGHVQGGVQAVQACGAIGGGCLQLGGVRSRIARLGTLRDTLRGQLGAHIQRGKLCGLLILAATAGALLGLLRLLGLLTLLGGLGGLLALGGAASASTLLSGGLVTRRAGALLGLLRLFGALGLALFCLLGLCLSVLLSAGTAGTASLLNRLGILLTLGGSLSGGLGGLLLGLRGGLFGSLLGGGLGLRSGRGSYGATTLVLLQSLNQLRLLQLQVATNTQLLSQDAQLRDLQICQFRRGRCRAELIGDNNIFCQLQFLWL